MERKGRRRQPRKKRDPAIEMETQPTHLGIQSHRRGGKEEDRCGSDTLENDHAGEKVPAVPNQVS